MTSYAVIGVGGVGGYYGIHLARAGCEMHYLMRSGGERARAEGLTLESHEVTRHVEHSGQITIHDDWATIPQVDVALVAVKAHANADVAPRLAGLLRPGGAVVLVQNGIDAEPGYAAALSDAGRDDVTVLGGLAFLAAERLEPHRFAHYGFGALTIGGYGRGYQPTGMLPVITAIADDLGRADVPVVAADDLLLARWQKLLWNIPFNGLSVVLDARTDALVRDATELVVALMAEVVAAAAADGRRIPDGAVEGMLANTRAMVPYAPSMKVDFDHGRRLELGQMYRAPLDRAARNGLECPRIAMLAQQLAFLDARNTAG